MIIKVPDTASPAAIAQSRADASMSRRDFAVLSAKQGWITEAEAMEWAGGNGIPAIAASAIGTLPEDDQFEMRMSVLTRTKVWRTDKLVRMLMAIKNVSPESMDNHFGVATK